MSYKANPSSQNLNKQITTNSMNTVEAKATVPNTEVVNINCPPPAAALKMAYERT